MTFKGLRGLGALAVSFAALGLGACGGGAQITPFVPLRVLAFGDEASVITADGRKYSVNALKTDGSLDCKTNPNWVQLVASSHSLVFPQCNPDGVAAPASRLLAAAGARVAELRQQVDQHLAADGFASRDLVLMMVGANDVLEQYALYPAQTEASLNAVLEQRGAELAAQVNRVATAGGKVVVSTVLDLGLTPFGLAEKAAHTDTDRAALLSRLTARFNAKLRVNMINDGRMIGLVHGDELVQSIVKVPSAYSITNATGAACAVALPDCTTATLASGASGDTWLWADALQLSAGGHKKFGELADARVRGNPF